LLRKLGFGRNSSTWLALDEQYVHIVHRLCAKFLQHDMQGNKSTWRSRLSLDGRLGP
jgi:hypothetical protein